MLLRTLYWQVRKLGRRATQTFVGKRWKGYCAICEASTAFVAEGDWYRDQLICERCRSIPRERALMRVISTLYPEWRTLKIHESSPGDRGASAKIRRECPGYMPSEYDDSVPFGSPGRGGARSESLEAQTFESDSFDLVITQDVFEHLFDPKQAIGEIVRTLRPGGAHIMSVPIVRKAEPSRRRASLSNGNIVHHLEPQYHSNPTDPEGSLVTVDWGYDLGDYLSAHSGCPTTIFWIDDIDQGIRAEYLEIVVTRKLATPDLVA